MCGITGVVAFTEKGRNSFKYLNKAVESLNNRGPDGNGVYILNNVALGHTRLSIIDTSTAASQPFTDSTGRYTIIFNGEFFNFGDYREEIAKQFNLRSHSDTETLLYLYIKYGSSCFDMVNGFFALAIYDNQDEKLFLARDRMGVKPLLYYLDNDKL